MAPTHAKAPVLCSTIYDGLIARGSARQLSDQTETPAELLVHPRGGTREHHGAPAEAMALHLEGLTKREAQGLAEGLTKGLAEGLAKGEAQGLAEGLRAS